MDPRNMIHSTIIFILCTLMIQLSGCSTDGDSKLSLTVNTKPINGGYVTPASGKFDSGTQLEIMAVPADGFYFQRWEEFGLGDENPLLLTLYSDRQVTAIFSPVPPPIFTTGMGTEANPFHLTDIHQLQAIDDPDFLDKHFIQMGDIDASPSSEFQNGSGFKHIGDLDTPFTGSYDGNGFVIRDLKLHIQKSQGTHTGLFGYIKNGRIENITIDNSALLENIQSAQQSAFHEAEQQTGYILSNNVDLSDERGIGGMVGFNDRGEVLNCIFMGILSSFTEAGGLVGINTGLVENSHVVGNIVSLWSVAGLVGINTGKIKRSSAKVSVSSPQSVFGLVNTNYGEISQSFAHVDLYTNGFAAGLVARNLGGRIVESFATGEIFSYGRGAGLVLTNEGEIINSYSQVNVEIEIQNDSGTFSAAGLVSENLENGFIENSYAAGTITVTGGDAKIGAIAVTNEGTMHSVYWDIDTTGYENAVLFGSSDGTDNLTTQQMTGQAARDNMPAFDWNAVWRITSGYPALRWEE